MLISDPASEGRHRRGYAGASSQRHRVPGQPRTAAPPDALDIEAPSSAPVRGGFRGTHRSASPQQGWATRKAESSVLADRAPGVAP